MTAQNGAVQRPTRLTVNNDSLTEPPTILSAPDGTVDENAPPGQLISTITAIGPRGHHTTDLQASSTIHDALSFDLITSGERHQRRVAHQGVVRLRDTRTSTMFGFIVKDPGGAQNHWVESTSKSTTSTKPGTQ